MKKTTVILLCLLFIMLNKMYATHNRAGEITYEYISGFTYKITITTYTKTSSIQADRCELSIDFGDGEGAVFNRVNGPPISGCSNGGEALPNDIKKNIYEGFYTYSGSGTYIISVSDPNRNAGVCNIPNSIDQLFFLRTVLIINPFLAGVNNSPVLLNPPIDEACVGECFEHNPSAFDVDGDSLSYSLVPSYADGEPIAGYVFPPNMPPSSIDPLRGDLVWCAPTTPCEYNVAILIKEYRRLPGSTERYEVGSVLRDMQINVKTCANIPPQIAPINDTCITAGSNLGINVTATDVNLSQQLKLTATGGPFQVNPTATFSATPSVSPANGVFNWTPSCQQVQLMPYAVTFKAEDNNVNPLVDFQTVFIRVIAPAPTGVNASPSGSSISLSWNHTLCNSTLGNNPLINYLIYRKNNCDNWTPTTCETSVPDYVGYSQIGSVGAETTTFTDNNNGQGLTDGIEYSYRIVAVYSDGSNSYASTNVCAKLIRDVPIITNVSVISTGISDSIWIHCIPPIGTAGNLDTIASPPPYEYRFMQAQGSNPAPNLFTQIASYVYNAFWEIADTGFVSTGINTRDNTFTYRVDFYSNNTLVGSTNTASSVYLSATPLPQGKAISLSWEERVPWINSLYYIYKETSPGSSVYALIDSTGSASYVDYELINDINYCYKIVSKGAFSDTTIKAPLFNHSQIKCERPIDTEPPCQPDITNIYSDCETAQSTITWRNPNTYCSDDAFKYKIYFAPTTEDSLFLIDVIDNLNITSYTYSYLYDGYIPSAAGCYAVAAIDSSNNESPIITSQCTDNCPVYELPNVFTPNNDSKNDLFIPLSTYRYIKDIDLKIYNRWGEKIVETTNTKILWDGTNMSNNKPVPEGVYFYVCYVNEIRVGGIEQRKLHGFIHLIR